MILANGSVMTPDEVVAALGQSPPWASYEIDDVRTVPLGADATALLYVGVGHRGGDEPSFVGVMASVYMRRGDGWALALYQQTRGRDRVGAIAAMNASAVASEMSPLVRPA